MMHETKRDWAFFRKAAHEMLWPKIDEEYQQELQGIVDGLRARTNSKLDVDDIVAMNAFEELPDYYVPWYDKQQKVAHAPNLKSPGNCSAFVATGSWTKDGKIVMAHNNWTNYANGERWRIMFDIAPKTWPSHFDGRISRSDRERRRLRHQQRRPDGDGDDHHAIRRLESRRQSGIRARTKSAAVCGNSIDEYTKIMLDGNNGGYANDWLLGDNKTGEIAQFELGLKAWKVWRTKDGAFAGSNWARDPKVIARMRRNSNRIIWKLRPMPGAYAGSNC